MWEIRGPGTENQGRASGVPTASASCASPAPSRPQPHRTALSSSPMTMSPSALSGRKASVRNLWNSGSCLNLLRVTWPFEKTDESYGPSSKSQKMYKRRT